MIKVCSAQFNFKHGDRMHFPFSLAELVAFIKENKYLKSNLKFEKSFIFRDKLNEYIEKSKDADILLGSCYIWNWAITLHLAKEVKKINPDCLIILGGPQVPNNTDGFFEEHPYVDIVTHGEGEIILENILTTFLKDKNYFSINGIDTKNFQNPPEPRINQDTLPSPYLTNTIWDLVDKNDSKKWAVNWETNRGCPYGCTFCDWGASAFNKVQKFTEERLFNEIEWFAENKLDYIECCDANFGMFQDRDFRIAKKLKETAIEKGSPKYFSSSWAKFSSDKIIPIAKELQSGKLLRHVTLALQSLDPEALKNVKRANIKFENFSELTETFRNNGLPTYSEIIRAMPGETVESFKKGLEVMLPTNITSMYIYNCAIYQNAPMNDPQYLEKFKIKTIKGPLYTPHSNPEKNDIQEYEDIVVGSYSATLDDIKEMCYYSWAALSFHMFGILDKISQYYEKIYGIKLMEVYEILLKYCRTENSFFSKEFENIVNYTNKGFNGEGWNNMDPKYGVISWHNEEISWLRLTEDKELLIKEIEYFVDFLNKQLSLNPPNDQIKDLIQFQIFLLTTRNEDSIKTKEFNFDWKNFFLTGELNETHKIFSCKNLVVESDPIIWGYNAIWFGRATKQFKCLPEQVQEGQYNHELNIMDKTEEYLSP
jgi:radical SAM superfamily enzyme YgiQ (UPF0313 family)